MDQWVLVVDGDSTSSKQMDVCRKTPLGLKGFIECNKPENQDATICSAVEFFPAFCHTEQRSCVYGLRETEDALLSLKTIVPSTQTKSPGPPPTSPSQ